MILMRMPEAWRTAVQITVRGVTTGSGAAPRLARLSPVTRLAIAHNIDVGCGLGVRVVRSCRQTPRKAELTNKDINSTEYALPNQPRALPLISR
jgi:hypothetical protein